MKYRIDYTAKFKKQHKKLKKQGKDLNKLYEVVRILANGGVLEEKYKNHKLINNKTYEDCMECHITPDWLLVYKIKDDELVLLLFATGSHSALFDKWCKKRLGLVSLF